jgi:hypothetical protein
MVNRLLRLSNEIILHQWRGCQVTYVDVVAMRRAAMTSCSSSEDSGVRSPLSGNASVNTVTTQQYGLLSVWSVPTAYKRSEFSVERES